MTKSARIFFFIFLTIPVFACGRNRSEHVSGDRSYYNGDSVKTRFEVPPGYKRVLQERNSFGEYLQNLRLKPAGEIARNYDGSIKEPRDVYEAVIDLDVGAKDLQQCADAVIRLRAEYLFGQQRYNEINFRFTNGFMADYSKWREGYRIIVKGNKATWHKKFGSSETYEEFRAYLDIVFTYAGTLSLSNELSSAEISDIQIGDIFIRGGSPGHAVIVVDLAFNEITGGKLFILAQSYMPAQDIQILKNQENKTISPWYSNEFEGSLVTPEWTFSKSELKRF